MRPLVIYSRPPGSHRLPQLWKTCGNGASTMTEIWASILKQLEPKLDPKELKTWFGPTRQLELAASSNGPVLTVSVPSRVFADWIQSRHGELLAREADAAGFPGLEIR